MSYQEDRFTEIANAIREKDGTTEPILATDFAARILEIPSGGEPNFALYHITQVINGNNCELQIEEGSSYKITTAELPNTTIELSFGGSVVSTKTTDATTGGKVSFNVNDSGTYTIRALDSNNTQLWTNTVTVSDNGEYIVKSGKALSSYTFAEWHTILQGGYFSIMFSLKDSFTYSQIDNILNNHKFFVENITQVGGKEIVDFRMASKYSGGNYNINPYVAYIKNTTATSWSTNSYSYGGYKYSAMRQRMMKQGDELYSQASGLLPDDYTGTLTTGVKFSDLKYTDTGLACSVYSYSSSADTFTLATTILTSDPSNTDMLFIKGYFKNVGQIDETTFNNGVYYTSTTISNAIIYTKETTWVSGTTYYGLYETLQEDGIFAGALKTSNFASYLAKFSDSASAGGAQTSMVSSFSDYADIPAVEEMTGVNRTTTLIDGGLAQSINAYNLAGEGTKKPSYDFSVRAIGSTYWTRSAYSNNYKSFCGIATNGSIATNSVHSINGVRLGFRLQ